MGICTSTQLMTKQSGSIMNLPITKVAMVIQINGKLQEFQQPITAGEIITQNPDCFICSSEAMNVNSLVPQLAKDEMLQLGQLYFLLPISKLYTPLSLQDMCVLAVKASTALNDYCNMSITGGGCVGNPAASVPAGSFSCRVFNGYSSGMKTIDYQVIDHAQPNKRVFSLK